MIWESFTHDEEKADRKDPSRGMTLVMLSVATSIDAVAGGLSLGVLGRKSCSQHRHRRRRLVLLLSAP